jgi:outer membrane biosynthesis protein TonB
MRRISIPLLLLLSMSSFAADPEPYLKSAPMPFYSPLARLARISGTIHLHFTVDGLGNTSDVEASPANEFLRRLAIENVQNWNSPGRSPATAALRERRFSFISFPERWNRLSDRTLPSDGSARRR